MKRLLFLLILLPLVALSVQGFVRDRLDIDPRIKSFHSITLEMSLKPFKQNNEAYIEQVCHTMFEQWKPLLLYTDTVSVLLWTADGSEILDYRGDDSQPLEWARYIGNPNTGMNEVMGLKAMGNEDRYTVYMEPCPEFNYGDLKKIVEIIKRVGEELLKKPVRIGATFDPGPEFAISEFKYKKHPEICMGATMGAKSMICCYATLNEDSDSYAAFPTGIPQGTPFGTFFGKQSRVFLSKMGFDYIWLSNGFGFGMETWASTGAIFDGRQFHRDKLPDIHAKIIDFWTLFRAECPDFRIETRGTNITSGADLAKDGVDLRAIYRGEYNLLPPPNSPWAAINYNIGLELAGYMSRIAELPDSRYLFRFYPHDPWWAFCPWINNYGREYFDIYLPLAVSRLNGKGEVELPTHLNFLTINDSYGDMPDQIPNEIIPHIQQARRCAPDAPGPLVWVYPFDEYYDWAQQLPHRLEEIFYGDWFIQQAINDGFPLNTVISTANLVQTLREGSNRFASSVLLSIVPDAGSDLETELIRFVESGGRLILYGPMLHAGPRLKACINVTTVEQMAGEFSISLDQPIDMAEKTIPMTLRHLAEWSGGGIETLVQNQDDKFTRILARASKGNESRDISIMRSKPEWNGGSVIYVRGTNSASYKGGHLLIADSFSDWFNGNHLLRHALDRLGFCIRMNKTEAAVENPINCISRSDNGYYFSGYTPNQTVDQRWKFPLGIPILTEMETRISEGFGTYRMPRSYFKECRLFVEQAEGVISCKDRITQNPAVDRKLKLWGLNGATVRFLPPTAVKRVEFTNQPLGVAKKTVLPAVKRQVGNETYYELKGVNGDLEIAWGTK